MEKKYCAYGEEGIEFVADTEEEVQKWIDEFTASEGIEKEYYQITSMTQDELDALPEV